jgi:hypothetical protein
MIGFRHRHDGLVATIRGRLASFAVLRRRDLQRYVQTKHLSHRSLTLNIRQLRHSSETGIVDRCDGNPRDCGSGYGERKSDGDVGSENDGAESATYLSEGGLANGQEMVCNETRAPKRKCGIEKTVILYTSRPGIYIHWDNVLHHWLQISR